jgi:hypothetical protein
METVENPKASELKLNGSVMIQKFKDFFAMCREGLLVGLFLLLLVFPGCFNSILERAGFTDGSFMGFTWKNKALQSQQVADSSQKLAVEASTQLEEMQNKLDSISKRLAAVAVTENNPEVRAINSEINSSKIAFKFSHLILKDKIQSQKLKLYDIFKDTKQKE